MASAAHLAAGTLPKAAQLKALRAHLEQAKRTLAAALPSLGSLLEGTVKAGFDVGGAYLGFCSERAIVVNLAPLLRRWNEAGTPVELLLTLAHEAAHLLSEGGAHDSAWRQTYDELIQAAIVAGVSWFIQARFWNARCCSLALLCSASKITLPSQSPSANRFRKMAAVTSSLSCRGFH